MLNIVSAIVIALTLCACGPAPTLPVQSAVSSATEPAPVATTAQTSPPAAAHAAEPGAATATASAAAIDDAVVDKAIDDVLGDHVRYRTAIEAFKTAVAAADAPAVAALIDYPFKTTVDGRKKTIANATAFVMQYDRILTPRIARIVAEQEYRSLFVNGKGVMFGRGEVWFNGVCEDAACKSPDVRVIAIQSTDR